MNVTGHRQNHLEIILLTLLSSMHGDLVKTDKEKIH